MIMIRDDLCTTKPNKQNKLTIYYKCPTIPPPTPPLPVKFIHRPMYAAHRCQHYKSSHNLCSPQFFFDTEKKETINLQKGLDLLDNLYANLFHFVDIWLLLKMHIFDL